MRHAVLGALFACLAVSAFAQNPRPDEVYRQAMMVESQFRELDGAIRLLAQGLRRDAFIVGQLMAAGKELTDFQHQVALQKAWERVQVAKRKAAERPFADERTILVLERLDASIDKAKDQGLSADIQHVRRDIFNGAGEVQYNIFRSLEYLKRVRKIYGEIQGTNGNTIADFDDALGDALAAALGMLEVKVTE